jgi:hypothetical protein
MSHVRTLSRTLVVLALLGSALALAASPASAQDLRVIIMENVDDGVAATKWQVRVKVVSLGGCTPEQGLGGEGFQSTWFAERNEVSTALNTKICSYSITAQARRKTSEVCQAQLAWGDDPDDDAYRNSLASPPPASERRVSVRAVTTTNADNEEVPDCDKAVTATFHIDPDDVVEELPRDSRDENLEERVRRAVEVTDFDVRVRPDRVTRDLRGCNVTMTFTMQGGDDGEVRRHLEGVSTGTACKFRVSITNDPAPFIIADRERTFETDASSKSVDLSGLVSIEPARIAIIQDVVGAAPDGSGVSYDIIRSCAGVDALPAPIVPSGGQGLYRLPGGDWRISLTEGRYTAHSDRNPNFGPGTTYQAAARSLTSSVVEGCSVSVTIKHVPESCSVSGRDTQTLTWRRSRRFDHFDVEFDITCNGASARPAVADDLPPAAPTPGTDGEPDVRIVARQLENGKIEFGLQQRQSDGSFGAPDLPRRRLFPTDAREERWLTSSVLTINVADESDDLADEVELRIIARKLLNGRVEFGLEERQDDGSWGGRQLPDRRFFPTDATVDRWLRSTVLTVDE